MGEISSKKSEAVDLLKEIANGSAILPYKILAIKHLSFLGEHDEALKIAQELYQKREPLDSIFHPFDLILAVWAGQRRDAEGIVAECKGPINTRTAHEELCGFFFAKQEYSAPRLI